MEIYIVYSAQIATIDDNKYHTDIEINHVSKTLEGAKEWIINRGVHGELEPYQFSDDDVCLDETPLWEVRGNRGDSWVYFIIKKEIQE